LPLALIDELQNCCDPDGIFQAKSQIIEGDQVQIQKGPFAAFVATVESIAPDARVWILIELLGQKSSVLVPPNDLLHA
jgi:transcriptional antiterminator RfaH